jgi:diguanylate cyclase (GGDEF)-like protein
VFLPESNLASARLLAETIRTHFSSLQIPSLPVFVRVTASFGIAERMGSENLSDLRRRADAALYSAKRGGRDRVVGATMPDADAMPAHPLSGTSLARSA